MTQLIFEGFARGHICRYSAYRVSFSGLIDEWKKSRNVMAATTINHTALLNLDGLARLDYTLFVIFERVSYVRAENFICRLSEVSCRAVPCFKLPVCQDIPAFHVLDVDDGR